jgi:hypothetical protein
MSLTYANLVLPPCLNRNQIRNYVITTFLSEQPGTGKNIYCSKYIYITEHPSTNRLIYLKRPAGLNKGMDFTIHICNTRFRTKGAVDMPSHKNIIADLSSKLSTSPTLYANIRALINNVFNSVHVTSHQCLQNTITAGLLTTEEVIMAIKWLFIEQDVTYWNWSGRNMLFNELQSQNLC